MNFFEAVNLVSNSASRMSNADQIIAMDQGSAGSCSSRTSSRAERRLSLPARVNVLVVDGQNYAQVSNLLRKNFKQRE